ncbi:MAG: parallel beta-helix domain-containing protein [Polyangiales bacterium]
MRFPALLFVVPCAVVVSCSSSTPAAPSPCAGVTGTCVGFSAGAKESDISAALVTAVPNTTIAFGPGTFAFTNTLNLSHVSGITITGKSSDPTDTTNVTILDFKNVAGSGEGILADTTDSLLLTKFVARDTKGNGIKVLNSNGVTWRTVKTLWSDPDPRTHGAYGLYPVQSHNVLIEGCEVAGAADAGVYVGQSDHIIVRNNDVHDNVAGIEIENSSYSEVHDNHTHDNVGGILVFNMPDLAVNEGGWNHVFNNLIESNNTVSFAARGSSVARVPGGTGSFVLGGHDVEIDHNTFNTNRGVAFAVVSYPLTGDSRLSNPSQFPYGYGAKMWPARVFVHDNTFTGNGSNPTTPNPSDCPDPTATTAASDCPDPVAFELSTLLKNSAAIVTKTKDVAPLLYDGIVDATATTATWGGTATNLMNICYGANSGDSGFMNLHYDVSGPLLLNADPTGYADITTDLSPYSSCTLPALATVTVTAP